MFSCRYYVAEPMTFGFRDRPEDKAKGVTAPVREYKDENGRDVYEVRAWSTDPSSFKVASMEDLTRFTQWREKDGLWKFTIKRETTVRVCLRIKIVCSIFIYSFSRRMMKV